MKILYVEDNMANLYLMKRIAHGHEVVNYIDGKEALDNFDTLKPDLVFMDIQLVGELSGLDVVRILRERGDQTPIVAVTAYAMVGDREKCIEAGCSDYLAKPLPIPEVLALIKRYDPANRPQAGPAPEPPDETETVETSTVPSHHVTMTSEAPVLSDDSTIEDDSSENAVDDKTTAGATGSSEADEIDPTTKPDAQLS